MRRAKKSQAVVPDPLLEDEAELGAAEVPAPLPVPSSGFYEDHVSAISELTGVRPKPKGGRRENPEAEAMFGRANELYLGGNYEEAVSILQNLILDHPSMVSAYLTLALIYEQRGEWHEAANIYIDAAERSKKGDLYMRAADLYAKHKIFEKAVECYSNATRWLKTAEPYLKRAEAQRELNDWANQALSLKAALDYDAKNLDVAAELAQLYEQKLGDYAASLRVLRAFFQQFVNQSEVSSSATPVVARGSQVPQLWDYEETLVLYGKALLRVKDWPSVAALIEFVDRKRGMRALPIELTFLLVISKIRTDEFEEARNPFQVLLRQSPSRYESHFIELATFLMDAHQWEEANKVLFHLTTEVQNPTVWFLMGQCYTKLKKIPLAAEYFERSVEADPAQYQYALALSEAYNALGSLDKGIRVLQDYELASNAQTRSTANNEHQQHHHEPTDASNLRSQHPPTHIYTPSEVPQKAGPMGTEPTPPPGPFKSAPKYAEVEARLQITIQKARLFFSKHEYPAFIDILTPFLSDTSIIFYRKKRRITPKQASKVKELGLGDAGFAKKGRGRRKVILDEPGPAGGITDFRPPTAHQEEEFHEDEFQMEGEEDMIEDEDAEFLGSAAPSRSTAAVTDRSKKRKRNEAMPYQSSELMDMAGEAEMTTFESSTRRWSRPTRERLAEMDSRKNAWEITGMLDFIKLLADYCKCLIYVHLASPDFFRIVETAYYLVSRETEFSSVSPELRADLVFQVAHVAYAVGKYGEATQTVRSVCREYPENPHVWNFFFLAASRARQFFLSKAFTMRLVARYPDSLALQLVAGHLSQVARSYQAAIGSYLQAYSKHSTFSITLLCTAVAYISRAMARSTPNRNSVVMKAFAFFYKYFIEHVYGAGGCKHEAYYNLARAFHHVSLFEYAIPLYELVLNDPSVDFLYHEERQQGLVASLKREAAYNLAIIYRSAGAHHLARELLRTHLTF
jgi:predicted Zn-dependent protease